MFADLMQQTVTVWRPGTRIARSGEVVETWEVPIEVGSAEGWLQPRQSSEDTDHRSQETLRGVLYMPVGSDVTADDRISLDIAPDDVWTVVGPPLEKGRPGGGLYLRLTVERVIG